MSAIAAQQTRRPTQRETVLRLLREHPEGCCVTDFEREQIGLGYAARNRVSELLRDGYPVISRRCRFHKHIGSVARYSLSGVATQLELRA